MNIAQAKALHFPVVQENGAVAECEALLAFDCSRMGKSYLIYTDNSVDESGALTLFASAYRKDSLAKGAGTLRKADLLPIQPKQNGHLSMRRWKQQQEAKPCTHRYPLLAT